MWACVWVFGCIIIVIVMAIELLEEGRAAGSKFTGTILSLRQDQQGTTHTHTHTHAHTTHTHTASLVRYSSRWNQNAKHCHVAQSVLAVLLGNLSQEVLLSLEDVGDHIKGFIPYTERHLQRLDRLEEVGAVLCMDTSSVLISPPILKQRFIF